MTWHDYVGMNKTDESRNVLNRENLERKRLDSLFCEIFKQNGFYRIWKLVTNNANNKDNSSYHLTSAR